MLGLTICSTSIFFLRMMMKLIKVGNGTNIYPGNFTKRGAALIYKHMRGMTLHLFSGRSLIGDVRVDYKFGNCTMDVFDYLNDIEGVKSCNFKTVIIDPPYNQRFADKYQKIGNTPKQFIIFANAKKTTELFNNIKQINPEIVILKSWNYYCIAGYDVKNCYVCYPGGYRKSTFLIVMEKQNNIDKFIKE